MNDSELTAAEGKQLVSRMKNVSFSGISGDVTIDVDGDRIADYALLDQTDPESGLFKVVIIYIGGRNKYFYKT